MNIYYLSPDQNWPSGGVAKIYRHVDILNKYGYSAYVLHEKKGFRCTWFENKTKVAYRVKPLWRKCKDKLFHAKVNPIKRKVCFPCNHSSQYIRNVDYLVVPEIYGLQILNMEPGVKKIIFNQGPVFTFSGYSCDPLDLRSPYNDPHGDVVGVMTNSHYTEEYMSHAFPGLKLFPLYHCSRDIDVFLNDSRKKKQICFMSRKNYADALQVINILKFRGFLKNYNVIAIDAKSLSETANIMKESLIFLSFCHQEGSFLPPSEAMLCGCVVIGYHGWGGREYLKPDFSFPIESGDIIGFAKTVEKVIKELEVNPTAYSEKIKSAAAFIKEQYSPAKEEAELVQIWDQIAGDFGRVCRR
ncbi:MAG: glycosyltransferase [Candidatus Omnitrophota bacterium]|jgi:hypothetical protein